MQLDPRLALRPVLDVPARAPTLIRIGTGNKIAEYGTGPTKIYGLKYNATSVASVLAGEIDTGNVPKTTGMDDGYQDGLCYGNIISPTGTTGSIVYVANKATPYGGSAQQDAAFIMTLPQYAFVWCLRTVLVQKSGDPATLLPVWLTWRA
jgi:hypothetical protein